MMNFFCSCYLLASSHSDNMLPCNIILSGSVDGSLRVWELATSSCVRVLQGHTEAVTSIVAGR